VARVAPGVLTGRMPIVLFAAWWFASAESTSLYFPSLRSIVGAFGSDWFGAGLTENVVPSLVNLAIGFVLATVLAVGVGLVLGLVRPLGDAVSPIVEFLRSVPGVALLPLGLLIFGLGTGMKVSLIAYAALWPILLNTIDGVRGIEPTLMETARSYGVSQWEAVRRIVLPGALPQIMAGMRTSLSLAVITMVLAEYFSSTNGIGYVLLISKNTFQLTPMWATILLIGLLGYLLNLLFLLAERRVLAWHRGWRAATPA
jgi:sulfonate transport system permease protein